MQQTKILLAVLAVIFTLTVSGCKLFDNESTLPPPSTPMMPAGQKVIGEEDKSGKTTTPVTEETPKPVDQTPKTTDNGKPPVVTNHARIITEKGTMIVELYGKDAPKTVANFVKLAKSNFYKNLTFHRVEKDPAFRLIQGGDPDGTGGGGSKETVPLEISPKLRHWKGALAMARTNDPNSASCQFYICINAIDQLNDNYAVFGKVTKNLDAADKINVGDKIKNIEIY
jgi:peptidyl-prolyl cis-trans isomerase B (cyclophilin B)